MDEATRVGMRRVQELLEAHMRDARRGGAERQAGKVSVTVDAALQLTAVRILDETIDARVRRELERSIVEAVNGARRQAVMSAAEAVTRLRESDDWKSAVQETMRPRQRDDESPA
jgi:DNA-binding protein YbaB